MNSRHDRLAPDHRQRITTPGEAWRMQAEDWNQRYATDEFI